MVNITVLYKLRQNGINRVTNKNVNLMQNTVKGALWLFPAFAIFLEKNYT